MGRLTRQRRHVRFFLQVVADCPVPSCHESQGTTGPKTPARCPIAQLRLCHTQKGTVRRSAVRGGQCAPEAAGGPTSRSGARRRDTGHRGAKGWQIPAWAGTNPSPTGGAAATGVERALAGNQGDPTAPEGYTATLSLMPSFGACTKSCFVPRYRSVVCTDRKSTRLNSSHANISYAVFCL